LKIKTNLAQKGLFLTVFWLPFINIIMYIGILISFFGSLNKIKLSKEKDCLSYAIMFFILIVFISVLTSMNKILSIYGFIAFCAYPVAYFIFLKNINEENFPKVIKLIIVSASIVITFGVVQRFLPGSILYRNDKLFINLQTSMGRVTSTLGGPNVLGAYLVLILPLIACLFFYKPSFKIGILFILGLICLVLTSSRGAWIGFVASFLLLLIIRKKIAALLVILLMFLIPLWTSPGLNRRIRSILYTSTYGERFLGWRTSLNIIRQRPLTGTGINTFYEVYPEFKLPDARERLCHAHNVFLHLGAETGVFGMGAFCILLIFFFKMCWRVYRTVSLVPHEDYYGWVTVGLLAGTVGFIVHNAGDYLFGNGQIGILFWIIMGFVKGLERMQNSEPRIQSIEHV